MKIEGGDTFGFTVTLELYYTFSGRVKYERFDRTRQPVRGQHVIGRVESSLGATWVKIAK